MTTSKGELPLFNKKFPYDYTIFYCVIQLFREAFAQKRIFTYLASVPCVSLAQSQALHDALTKAGVSSKLVVMPDAVHGDTVFYREDAREQILRFLRGQMGE